MAGRGKPGHYGERRNWYGISGVTFAFMYCRESAKPVFLNIFININRLLNHLVSPRSGSVQIIIPSIPPGLGEGEADPDLQPFWSWFKNLTPGGSWENFFTEPG
jgi:hypothetical protein